MNGPLVSVIMPIYNSEAFLEDAVASVMGQDYARLELVAVDDRSTDSSLSIVERLATSDRRIVVQPSETNAGGAAARNAGLRIARGSYFALLDSDDIAAPNRLSRQVEFLQAHPDVSVVGCGYRRIDENGDLLTSYVSPLAFDPRDVWHWQTERLHPALLDPSTMFRREAIEGIDGYREQFPAAYDYDVWLRMQPCRMSNLDFAGTDYRIHGSQTTSSRASLASFSHMMAYASFVYRQRGDADPVAGWEGELDVSRLRSLDLDPVINALLYARLLLIEHQRPGQAAHGPSGLTVEQFADYLGSIELQETRLREVYIAPLMQAAGLLSRLGWKSQARHIVLEVLKSFPGQMVREVTRPARRRIGLARPFGRV